MSPFERQSLLEAFEDFFEGENMVFFVRIMLVVLLCLVFGFGMTAFIILVSQ